MAETLTLLPGWGFTAGSLQPLAAALGEHGVAVRLLDLPAGLMPSPEAWLDALDSRAPSTGWLGGWSLGGMLASLLAARRGAACGGLVTLASNLRFVADQQWPHGLPQATFAAFRAGCAEDARATLRRFAALCSQGGAQPRTLCRGLQQQLVDGPAEVLLDGLEVLRVLDTASARRRFGGPRLQLFAAADALVPATAAAALGVLDPLAQVRVVARAGHAFVVEQAALLAAQIAAFMERRDV